MNVSQTITSKKVTIGFPKALMYFQHGTLWEAFFKALGCTVVISRDTNKTILDLGVRHCNNETCLPVKVFHGHVLSLKDIVDFIFIPRYISLEKNAFSCPQFCGLPDSTQLNLKGNIKIIEIKIDLRNGMVKTQEDLKKLSQILSIPYETVKKTYSDIIGTTPVDNIQPRIKSITKHKNVAPTLIAVLGHPYMIYDSYLSMNLINKLSALGIIVVTAADIDTDTKHKNAEPFNNRTFWSMGFDTLGSAYTYISQPTLNGIIYLTPFACGIDSIVTEFIERRLRNKSTIHYLKLTMDEHTGEAGFNTRLEAFLDMVQVN